MDTKEIDRLLAETKAQMDDERERCLAVGRLLSDLPLDRAISILRRSLEAAERVAAMRANADHV